MVAHRHTSRKVASDSGEPPQGEVRRTSLLGTWVNKDSLYLTTTAGAKGSVHKRGTQENPRTEGERTGGGSGAML
jgi:hypothetical protein